ncbi:MAG: MBL fold metallo-hydrolase [Limisphaerales bacterium]
MPTSRAMRMAASRDGKRAAFGWLCLSEPAAAYQSQRQAVSVWSVNPRRPLWNAAVSRDMSTPALPQPAADFPALVNFRLAATVVEPGTVTAAVALNADCSRVAVLEYAVQVWVRSGPAIGKWDPPIHLLNFVPHQRGRLRVFDGNGKELLRETLPEPGLFELGFGGDADALWCWPASWFARGMAGEPWLPVRAEARTLYRVSVPTRSAVAMALPDAVSDCAPCPTDGRAWVADWSGAATLLDAAGKVISTVKLGAPARLAWSGAGTFAVAGTADGKLFRIERDGKLAWQHALAVTEPFGAPSARAGDLQSPPRATSTSKDSDYKSPALTPPPEVVAGIPVHQGGRIPGEHAYVGDIWLLKLGRDAVLVDAGGTSGFATSQARVRALGCERVTHVLHTHSHGDHCGGAYLWRAAGAKIVSPKSAALTLTWLMPMLTDYGIYPPRPLDVPLPLARVGDETEFTVSGQKFRALFVPGHSFDLTVYMTELGGKRVAFTGDLGFERESDIVHRCWGDAEKARPVIQAIREKLLAWKPDVVFTGHGVRPNGTEWVEDLLRRSEESLAKAGVRGDSK